MTASSPHLAMLGYYRAVSAPAGGQPTVVGVDPAMAASFQSPGYDVRPHTISSAYERYHARSALSAATFEPPLRAPPPSVIHRPPPGPPLMRPPMAGLARGQHPPREEVIYQSVLRTPGSPHQLQQQAINNGICDTTPGSIPV